MAQAEVASAPARTSPLNYFRLSLMMFLQYAIWGAWTPVLSLYLEKELGFSGSQIGHIYSLLWLACIISPFLGGQIADRWVPTQWFLAVAHFIGGLALFRAAAATTFGELWFWMLVYALFFAPTLALTNSLAFKHLANTEREFGFVRVFGTIGWIVAGAVLTGWRRGTFEAWGIPPYPSQADCLLLASLFAFAMAAFCLALPHTPPTRSADPWAFLKALRMARDRRFLIFLIISFVVTTELQFYYMLSAPFLNDIGVSPANVPITKTLAQIAEIFVMFIALPLLLPHLGFRRTLAIGVLAWPLRYIIWAYVAYTGHPVWLAIAALTLHGFCYVFFFTASQIYVDVVAPRDIRHSAQALLTFVTLGLGNYLGTHFTGFIWDLFRHPKVDELGRVVMENGKPVMVTDWHLVFIIPIIITVSCAIAFLIFFEEPRPGEVIGAAEGRPVRRAEPAGEAEVQEQPSGEGGGERGQQDEGGQ